MSCRQPSSTFAVFSALLFAVGCGGSGSGSGSGSGGSPTAPSGSTSLSGTWTGTLSRPDGLTPIGVRWQVTHSGTLSGPMTLTNGSSSVTFTVQGVPSGPGTSIASIHFNFTAEAGTITTLPNCRISASTSADATGLREPITVMTTGAFTVSYNQCQGFLAPPAFSTFLSESTVLSITTQ